LNEGGTGVTATDGPTRRQWLGGAAALGAGLAAPPSAPAAEDKAKPFRFLLNTATIMGQKLSLVEEIELAAKAGYDGLEPWVREIDQHAKGGGDLKDLNKRIRDAGLTVDSAIDFFEWIVDDDDRRKKGLEAAKRSMDLVRQIGGVRVAAPPAGATDQADLNLFKAADRFRALCEIGADVGVTPQVEVWGFSRALGRLGEALLVAVESGRPEACVLPDVFHLYKGGSGFAGARAAASAFQVIHCNDYPADPPRALVKDEHRLYPGDGVAPLKEFLRDLHAAGFCGFLSLELFNQEYWKKDALLVAKTGLEKLKAVAAAALETKP
jgi:sugar phosphate isomerase/epimerase